MKKYFIVFLFSIIGTALNAQGSFRIKVVDSKTIEGIAKALVFIEEIPIPDQETDVFGLVTYQNVPQDRKVRVNVRKKGYLPQQVEIVANKEIKVDNNIVIKLEKESTKPQVIIYGEVTDKNNEEVVGASVEVTILGRPYSDITDSSGNYQIKIDRSILISVPSFQIEAKKKDCERAKSTEAVLQSDYINKDIKLNCSNSKPPPLRPEDIYEDENISYTFKECKRVGSSLQVKLLATAKGKDIRMRFYGSSYDIDQTKIFDNNGNKFIASSIRVANADGMAGFSFVMGLPTEVVINFQEINSSSLTIPLLELVFNITGYPQTAKFRNLTIN